MFFGTVHQLNKTSQITVQCDITQLERVEYYKYLGVILDSKLNFQHHIEYVESKVLKRIGVLGRASRFLSKDTCYYLYKQLILPIMDYSDHIYAGTTQRNQLILQKLQNSAARCILHADRLTPSAVLHSELDMDRLHVRRDKHICIYMFKIMNGILPEKLRALFKLVSDISIRDTRQSRCLNIYIHKPRIELTKRSFIYYGAVLWNSLPEHIKLAPTLECFKTLLNDVFI